MKAYIWYFFAYSFLGWCTEVVFAAFKNGRFVNRGFLNGPICPIYGFGLVAVLYLLEPLRNNLLLLYIGSVVLTTGIELVTGFLMEKLFHHRWWDYSKMPLNIGGYVCLPFSLIWGIACLLIVDVLQPRIAWLPTVIPEPLGTVLLVIFGAGFLTDVCVTVATVAKLNRRLTQIDDVSAALRTVSDRLGASMADGALLVKATDAKTRDDLAVMRNYARDTLREADEKSRAELKASYNELVERLGIGSRRLLNAFPAIRSTRHPDALAVLKEKLSRLRDSRKKRG